MSTFRSEVPMLPARASILALAFTTMLSAAAQSPSPALQSTPDAHTYTLHTGTHIVLTDVLVTDAHGNPVHNLPRSAFRIFDNHRPQQLSSFSESTAADLASQPTALPSQPGVFSNEFIRHPTAVLNVLFIDTTTISLDDQMYLFNELKRFVQQLPAGRQLAIYARGGAVTLLLQNFTSDHILLDKALADAIPHLRQADAQFASDPESLQQISTYLAQYPGHKNVIWFSGGSRLFLMSDPTAMVDASSLRPVYDELEAARISIYPVDARGLTVGGADIQIAQHDLMNQIAEATGGEALYHHNDLALAANLALNSGSNFYTLTYTPHDLTFNNAWHKIKVQVEGAHYTLSYRHGYFDDGSNLTDPAGDKPRTRLLADGATTQVPSSRKQPIVFQVRVSPAAATSPSLAVRASAPAPSPRKHEVTYDIHFNVPASDLTPQPIDGHPHVLLGAGILALNHLGRPVGRIAQDVNLTLDDARLQDHPNGYIAFDQQIALPAGAVYLEVMVWDRSTGRLGTVHVPIDVAKP